MNIKTLSMTIAAGSLLATGAMADYTEMSYDAVNNGDGTWTARIFANFDAATDELDAVYGDADNLLSIDSTGGFYQNAFGGATSLAINPALYDAFPSLVNDSWVTIGLEDQVGNNMLTIGIDYADFEAGGNISTDNGTWFATPADAQVYEVNGRVLVGQFTVGDSDHVYGQMSFQGKNADGSNWTADCVLFDTAPAPGALALLGLAGIATRRRRK